MQKFTLQKEKILSSLKKDLKQVSKGFTLIELLVVIAIIGILATIVLTSLGNARGGANDSKIKGQLSNMRGQAQLYTGATVTSFGPVAVASGTFPTSGGGMFTDTASSTSSLYNLASSLPSGTSYTYGSDGSLPSSGGKWFFAASLSNGGYFCVDYTGATKTGTSTLTTSVQTSNICN